MSPEDAKKPRRKPSRRKSTGKRAERAKRNLPVQRKSLGDLLIRKKVVDPKLFNDVIERAATTGKSVGSSVVDMGLVGAKDLCAFLSEQHKVPVVDLSTLGEPDEEVLKLVSKNLAAKQ